MPSPKGSSTHITAFVQALAIAGYQVDLLTPGDAHLPAQDHHAGARLLRVALDPALSMLRRATLFDAAVAAHLATHTYDLVHFRSIWGGLAALHAQPQYGYRTLFEVNGLPSIELKYHYPGLADGSSAAAALIAQLRAQEAMLIRQSDLLITPAAVTATFLASLGADPARLRVIPNGATPLADVPPPLQGDLPTLLYIGTLADWQGLHTLIAALPMVLAVRPVRLRIVGSGRSRQRRALAKLAAKLGVSEAVQVEEPVPHAEVADLIASADVCVAPLEPNDRNVTQGCCPIKVIEYMAAARPLVAANLPVVRELLREDVEGLLAIPGNPRDLARSILSLLDDPARAVAMGQRAAMRVRSSLTWQHAQQRLLAVYEQVFTSDNAKTGPGSVL
ncbi:glycosyltransferase family 4 protein [Candidatus Oscillochloris fontis]|uniref:glycosyltransferase family 4 protein n=1 Tax=Candidatus Oscillochloris fontis TaxID=2496868 RepID=UPI00237A5B49|nr:glycosyltransferase family 4 protein [Candidatus Oscillochloris fontis]